MHSGKEFRLKGLFDAISGNTVIVAADHGGIAGPMPGIENPRDLITACGHAGASAVLATKGFFAAAESAWPADIGFIMRVTGGFTTLGGSYEDTVLSSVETALRYGAAGVAATIKFGHDLETRFIAQASLLADSCDRWNIPLLVEALPQIDADNAKEYARGIKLAARASAEIGADIVKVRYAGPPDLFAEAVAGCPVPVVVLGGARTGNLRELLHDVAVAMRNGARGVAMGRNVWQEGNVIPVISALKALVHDGASVDEALRLIPGTNQM